MILFNCISAIVITMTITVYTPGVNAISGGMYTASGKAVQDGMAACGRGYKFGTYFEVLGDSGNKLSALGISNKVICQDRGGAVSNNNLDVALVSGDNRLKRAYGFGRRKAQVLVVGNGCANK